MEDLKLTYEVDGDDISRAGEASRAVKNVLKQLNFPSNIIRKVSICMYEGEINMVIHADGGVIHVIVDEASITMILKDKGPGIKDIDKAMQEGWSTASAEAREMGFGAGMGLPNMKRSCDEFNIETELNVGTTVTMKLFI